MQRDSRAGSGGWVHWATRLATVAVLVVSAAALAQGAPEGGTTGGSPAAGKAWDGSYQVGIEEGQARDEVSGETMLVAAYGILWLILVLFVLRAQSQVAALRRESAELKAMLESRLPQPGQAGKEPAPR